MAESSSRDSHSLRSEAAKRRRLDEELLQLLDAESSTGSSASSSSDSSSSRDDDDDLTLYEFMFEYLFSPAGAAIEGMPPTNPAYEMSQDLLKLGKSTHHRMMYRVMYFLLDIAPRIVTFPDDMEKVSNDFKQGLADELKFVFVHLAALLAFLNALSSPLGAPHLVFFF
ncbi:hypothetical protein MRX96_055779 [Rhipicephalus microplus]